MLSIGRSSSSSLKTHTPGCAAAAKRPRRASAVVARCCQVTLPCLTETVKASARELEQIRDFLHHWGNGTVRRLAPCLAPGVVVLEPLFSKPERPTVLCGLDELDYHRSYDSDFPPDLSISIVSAISEQHPIDEGMLNVYVSFRATTPYSAVEQALWRFVSTSILALPERKDDIGLLRFTFTPQNLISEVACLRKPMSRLRSSYSHSDSYNLCDPNLYSSPGPHEPALKLLEQM